MATAYRGWVAGLAVAALLQGTSQAQTIRLKANNATDLNQVSSWTNSVAPGVYEAARWTNIVLGASSVNLGANLSMAYSRTRLERGVA